MATGTIKAVVSKSDVVNNLTTNDSTKVLSAAQGKALNDQMANIVKVTDLGTDTVANLQTKLVTLFGTATIGVPCYFQMTPSSASGVFENTSYTGELNKINNTRFKVFAHRGASGVEIVGYYNNGTWGWDVLALNNQITKFGKVLWEGTKFISGELTVSGMSNYRMFIFMYSNTAPLIAIINSGIMWCGMQYGQYNAPGILGLAARYAYSSDKLTINQLNRGLTDGTNTNYDGNLTEGIVKIIGIA